MVDESEQYKALSLAELADELEHWTRLVEVEGDRSGAFAELKHIYKFAISNYDQPGIALLLEALDQDSREA